MIPENFERARRYAEARLEKELSQNLVYHGITHTRNEVVQAVKTFAEIEGVQGESLLLLLTAAWFHDIGFIEQATYHETIGAQLVSQVLPSFGYTDDQIEIVRGAILATVLPQSPKNLLEKILADADLDVLGRENFMKRNQDLRREFEFLGRVNTDEEWYTGQLKFIEEHKYFTDSARSLRNAQKLKNIVKLRNVLESLASDR